MVGPTGQILRGTTDAALTGGSFRVTDGVLTCDGNYNDYDFSPTLVIPAKCSDGRTGIITAMREPNGVAGMGTIAVSDGTTWQFAFGSLTSNLEQSARQNRSPQPPAPAITTARSAPLDMAIGAEPQPSTPQPAAREADNATVFTVAMKTDGGTFVVPVTINDAIRLDFVVDSGAADVSVPADVVLTLTRTGTITSSDFLGSRNYQLADGSSLPSPTFRIKTLKVGEAVVSNVTASVAPVRGSLLLGQSFLQRFKSWSVDNNRHLLVLQGPAEGR